MPRRDAATELAEKLLRVLASQRDLGAAAYPLRLRCLAELTDPHTQPELLRKAVTKKLFTAAALVSRKNDPEALVFLTEDMDKLAASAALLESVLGRLCSAEKPLCPLAKLRTQVAAALKKPFSEAVSRHIREQTLPPSVGCVEIKKSPHLYLRRFPPPKPPDQELAEKLHRTLEAQRQRRDGSYPLTFKRLLELTESKAPQNFVRKAIALPWFQERVAVAMKTNPEAPVALRSDLSILAGSPLVLEVALRACRTRSTHALGLAALTKRLIPDLQAPFRESVQRGLDDGSLPASVGWILKREPVLFLMADLNGGRSPQKTTPLEIEFIPAFDEAFAGLDRQGGGHNFVSLVDLRKALPMSRPVFDAGLAALRRAGRYTLSDAEGRRGLGPEERAAAIVEDGALLLFVSRKTP